jgi:serine protease Do
MVSRSSTFIVSLSSLGFGILLGALLGRGGPTALAQIAASDRAGAQSHDRATTAAQKGSIQRRSDDDNYAVLARQYEQFRSINRTFELVAKTVSPAVVHIVAAKFTPGDRNRRARRFDETGSGVIVRSNRGTGLYVLTNHHVIDGADLPRIHVRLQDGRTISPVKTWNDSKADIAVLKLDRDDLPAARLGNSDDAPVGTWVLALGSPFGLTHSVSQGIISARSRHMDELQDVENQDFLQTDAAINPGNSGGPLVNMKGEVVGINNSIASNGGGNEGVGFSIPINLARWIMDELIVHGRVKRGALGVDLKPDFGQEAAVALGMERPRGALIAKVYPDSPADRAGIRDGDVILRFGGIEIVDLNHLINSVSMAAQGQPAEVVVWRDRREIAMHVTVGDRESTLLPSEPRFPAEAARDSSGLVRRPDQPDRSSTYALGMELTTLDAQLAERIDLPASWRGAVVLTVDPESPLSAVVRPHDVISAIDNQAIQSAEQAVRILKQRADHGSSIISLDRMVQGNNERQTIRVP